MFGFAWARVAAMKKRVEGPCDGSLEERNRELARRLAERERELEIVSARADEARRVKSDFLAMMSHEIRTPLTAILGFAELLKDDHPVVDRVGAADAIRRNGEHLLLLISDILDASKIEAGKLTVDIIEAQPREVIDNVVELLRQHAESKGLEIRVEGDLPEWVLTDPMRLRQILVNLVGNAIKFTGRGGVTLRLDYVHESSEMSIAVVDSGIGLSSEQRATLQHFEAFTHTGSSTAHRFGGSGVGLGISQALAKRLGGGIRIESEKGRGSTFTVCVKAEVAQAPSAGTWTVTGCSGPPASSGVTGPLAGVRVLLAEDGPDNQVLIARFISDAGGEIEVVGDGMQALDRLRRERVPPVSLVLMDMNMPMLDGYRATQRLREQGFAEPIIALTAYALDGDRERCLRAGCSDYLSKPVRRADLIECCRRWADAGMGRAAA